MTNVARWQMVVRAEALLPSKSGRRCNQLGILSAASNRGPDQQCIKPIRAYVSHMTGVWSQVVGYICSVVQ